ncbi:uncharacterized protein TNCV_17491 [Trichonephila clavipes]|nr:uncharacterized protein TNCV_17491 [Trichonephila clavipes]
MSSNPVPLKTLRVGQQCTLNLSRAETSSRWCGGINTDFLSHPVPSTTEPSTSRVRVGTDACESSVNSISYVTNTMISIRMRGHGSLVVKVSDRGWSIMSSSRVAFKTRRVGVRCTLNLSRAQMCSRWCGVVVRRGGLPAQMTSSSLDLGSKLRSLSPKALVYLNSAP